MNPSPSIDNDLSWMIMMINLLFIIAYVIWIRRSLNYIYSNKLMKHTIYENEFAPMMKKHTNPNTASNPRRATVHFNTTPETTPVKFRKQYTFQTCSHPDFDNFIKSPLQTNQLLSNTTHSKHGPAQQHNNVLDITDAMSYSKSYMNQKKSYSEYNQAENNQKTKRSSSEFELRQTLAYIEQILGDLIDKGNYALAKRYAQKLSQTTLKDKIQKLIVKIQQKQTRKQKLQNIFESHRQQTQRRTMRSMSQDLKLRNSQLEKQSQQMYNLYLAEKNKLRQQYEIIYTKIHEENNKIKKELDGKSKDLEKEKKQNSEFKFKYEQMFKDISQQLKDIKTQHGILKTENYHLICTNQQLSYQNLQFSKNIQTQNIKFYQLEQELNEVRMRNGIMKEQISKLEALNLKFKNYADSFLSETKRYQRQNYKYNSDRKAPQLLNEVDIIPTCLPLNKMNDQSQIPSSLKSKDIDQRKNINPSKIEKNQFQRTVNSFQQNIDEINNQIKLKQQQLEQLQKHCQNLHTQIHTQSAKLKQYEETQQILQAECLKYEDIIKNIINEIEKSINMEQREQRQKVAITNLKIAVDELEYYINDKNNQLKSLQTRNKQGLAQYEDIQRKLSNKQSQLQIKIKELAAVGEAIHQNQEVVIEGEKKLLQIKQNIQKYEHLNQQCQQAQLKLSQLINNCTGIQDQLDKVNGQIIQKNDYKQTLLKEIDILKNEMLNSRERLKELIITHQGLQKKIGEQSNILLNIQANSQSKRKHLQAEMQSNHVKLQKLKQELLTKSKKISDLQRMHISLAQKAQKSMDLQPQQSNNSQMIDLQAKKQILRKQIFNSQQIISRQDIKIKQNQQILDKYEHVLTGVSQMQQQNKRLEENVSHNTILILQQNFQLEKMKNQHEALVKELDQKKKQLDMHVSFVQESLASISKLNQQMDFWENQLEKLRIRQEQLQSEVLLRQNQLQNIQKQLQNETNQYRTKEEQLKTLESQYQNMQDKVNRQKDSYHSRRKFSLTLVHEVNSEKIKSNQIKTNNEILKEELRQLLERKKSIEKEISVLSEVLVILQSDIWLKQHQLRAQYQDKYTQTDFPTEMSLIEYLQ